MTLISLEISIISVGLIICSVLIFFYKKEKEVNFFGILDLMLLSLFAINVHQAKEMKEEKAVQEKDLVIPIDEKPVLSSDTIKLVIVK